jgi:hypothetical protein
MKGGWKCQSGWRGVVKGRKERRMTGGGGRISCCMAAHAHTRQNRNCTEQTPQREESAPDSASSPKPQQQKRGEEKATMGVSGRKRNAKTKTRTKPLRKKKGMCNANASRKSPSDRKVRSEILRREKVEKPERDTKAVPERRIKQERA